MPISMQHMSTSALVGTALSVALAPRQGAASVQQGADLLEAFSGAGSQFTNWANNTDPCGEAPWEGVTCQANQVYAINLETNGTAQCIISVDLSSLPTSVQVLVLRGPGFTDSTTNCSGLSSSNINEFGLINTTDFALAAHCSWSDLPLSNLKYLILQFPGVLFGPSVPWSSFEKLEYLELVGMGLNGTIQLSELPPSVRAVDVSSNNFTRIGWAGVGVSSNLSTFVASDNEISQTMTAADLPRGLGVLFLQNNPLLVGSLEVSDLPETLRDNATVLNVTTKVGLTNTQLCFTGTPEMFQGSTRALFLPRQCSIDQGRGLLAAFPGVFPGNWIAHTDPCGINGTGPFWKGITCGNDYVINPEKPPEALVQVQVVKVESSGQSPPIPVRFDTIPFTVYEVFINGTSFQLVHCKGLHDLPKLGLLYLFNMTTPEIECDWDDFALDPIRNGVYDVLSIHDQSVKFSSSVVPWSKLAGVRELRLYNMGLTGTVDLAPLCNLSIVFVPGNNFTHINWAPDCACNANLSSPEHTCMYYLDVSRNAIDQTMTADELPHSVTVRLEYNPLLVGNLEVAHLPETLAEDGLFLRNTQLCFIGTPKNYNGSAGAPEGSWHPRKCSIEQGRGLLAAFPGAFPGNWTADTDPCGVHGTGPFWKGITCGTSAPDNALVQVVFVGVESYGQSPPIPVRFDTIPSTVRNIQITGTSFKLADCKGLNDLPNLFGVEVSNMTTPEIECDWDDFVSNKNGMYDVLSIKGQSVRFSSSVVPWSKFAGMNDLSDLTLSDMGLTGTVDLATLCHVAVVQVPGNNFTHINWAPDCACNTSAYDCMYILDVSQNAIDQTITAGDLPPHISDQKAGFLRLNDNPMLQGALDATEMPAGFLKVINEHAANVSKYYDFQNTSLCFTGMHSASAATKLTRAEEEWFAAHSCPATTAAPTAASTAAIIAGSVVGSIALLALIGAGVAYGMMRKQRAVRRGPVTTEDEESLTAEYEMKSSAEDELN